MGKTIYPPFLQCCAHTGEDKVMQPSGDVIAAEGDTVTLDCTFQTSDRNPYLFWYKQELNGYPKYMLKKLGSAPPYRAPDFEDDRFQTEIQDKSVPLEIQKLQLSDSAVYYCALRPTVTYLTVKTRE
uniref:Ig-like domain-containing protein n=1 Tax=Acanthochromis polyacanthus TaxID=80966 RepID=A0A3Q1FRE3_9TELE